MGMSYLRVYDVARRLKDVRRIIVTGCGSAYYAGLIGEHLIEEFAGIPVEIETASELRHRPFTADPTHAVLLAISHREKLRTRLKLSDLRGRMECLLLGVVNVVGSTITRETDAGVHNHAGPEIGVASTKAIRLTNGVLIPLIAIFLGRMRTSLTEGKDS